MSKTESFRVQSQAAVALAEWKAFFADQVALQAKELAKASDSLGLITIDHYRQAAKLAVPALEALLQDTDSSNDRQEAA